MTMREGGEKRMEFQIRDENFGLALYEAETARAALVEFFADRARGEVRPRIAETAGGEAEIIVDGERYRAVRFGRLRLAPQPTEPTTRINSTRR